MYKRLLVPLDGSKTSEQILPYVSYLAKGFQSRIELFHVVDPALPELAHLVGGADPAETITALKKWSGEYLEETVGSFKELGLEASYSVCEGNAASCVIREAADEADTLITMTTHGRSGYLHWVLGSVANRVLQRSTTPLMMLRAQEPDVSSHELKIENLIVPLDGSELAERVLPHVVDLAKALQLNVVLVRVTPYGEPFDRIMEYVLSPYGDLSKEVDEQAAWYLYRVSQELRQQGISHVEEQVLHGHPAVAIINFARVRDNDLVVLTSHGSSGTGFWYLGSITDQVARYAGGPVLIVPAAQGESARSNAQG